MINHVTLQKFYEATKIPLQLFDDNILIQNYASGAFYPNPATSIINLAENTTHPVCYTISPEHLFYGLIRIHNSSEYLTVGPAMSFECTQKQAQNILTGLQQPVSRTNELLRWFRTIPICDIQRFCGILYLLDYILTGATEHDAVQISSQKNNSPTLTIDNNPSFIDHFSDLLEKQILSCVEYGNSDELEAIFNNFDSPDVQSPLTSSDTVRFFKNIFIFSTGVVSRTAMKGGLDYDTAITLSNSYVMQIEMLYSYSDILNLVKQMFMDYTKRTARCRSFLSDSLLVNKIYKDVQAHLYEKITPTSISERLNMNCSYLCRHFKQETGKTITEFINQLKIDECIRLLKTTEMTLIQISTQLGYSSQNYFHTVFKKITGMTPIAFKNKT